MVVEPGVYRAFAILLLAVTGNGNEPDLGKLGRLSDESVNLIPVEAREADVEQNGVGSEGFRGVNDRRSFVDFLRHAAELLKEQGHGSCGIDVILDDQNS